MSEKVVHVAGSAFGSENVDPEKDEIKEAIDCLCRDNRLEARAEALARALTCMTSLRGAHRSSTSQASAPLRSRGQDGRGVQSLERLSHVSHIDCGCPQQRAACSPTGEVTAEIHQTRTIKSEAESTLLV